MNTAQNIRRAARIAELRENAKDLAKAARPPAVIAVTRTRRGVDPHRLLLLLAQERRRRARLLAELVK